MRENGTTMTAVSQLDMHEVRAILQGLYLELTAEYDEAAAAIVDIGRHTDTDGDDEVDTGAKTALREHHLSLMMGIDERRSQVERALERLDAGTYGRCETCDQQISIERLEAFPSATLCVRCKQAGERR
jgi:DnaK suppressor protein